MTRLHFTTTFVVDQTPEAVFVAINNVRGWWSGDIDGDTDRLGETFTYRFAPYHYSKQQVIALVPGTKVAWRVVESSLNFVRDKAEWTGTDIVFDIAAKNGATEVRFTHVGLVPDVECYRACSNAWGSLINGSLHTLIATGVATTPSFAEERE